MISFVIILPLFVQRFESFASGVDALGVSAMAYALTSIAAAPFIGILADRLGSKPALVLGVAFFSIQYIGLAIFREATWIVICFILTGLGNAIYDPASSAYILDIIPSAYYESQPVVIELE